MKTIRRARQCARVLLIVFMLHSIKHWTLLSFGDDNGPITIFQISSAVIKATVSIGQNNNDSG